MQILIRLKRIFLTTGLLLGVAFIAYFAVLVIAVGSAIAFSGSTGAAHQRFLDGLAPIFSFIPGAVAFGGVVALINAAATEQGLWVKAIATGSVVGGIVTAINPSLAKELISLIAPALSLIGKILLKN